MVQIVLVGISKHQKSWIEDSYLTGEIENWNPAGDLTELSKGWWNNECASNSSQRPMYCQIYYKDQLDFKLQTQKLNQELIKLLKEQAAQSSSPADLEKCFIALPSFKNGEWINAIVL